MKLPSNSNMARLYRVLLALYPAAHRREYGTLMEQLFRDRCREVLNQRSLRSLARFWWSVLADLIVSAPSEHVSQLIQTMKTQNFDKLSFKLLLIAIVLSAVAAPVLVTAGLAPACLYLSTLALLARAVAEWHRAPGEWLRGLLWMAGMLLVYGLIMPFWAKMHVLHGDAYPSVPLVDAGAIFLNVAIALFRPLISRLGGSAGGHVPS
jgi:hypothetical protein